MGSEKPPSPAEARLHNTLLEINSDWSDWGEAEALARVLQMAADALKGRPNWPLSETEDEVQHQRAGEGEAEAAMRAILDAWDEFESIDPQLVLNALSPHFERVRAALSPQRAGEPPEDEELSPEMRAAQDAWDGAEAMAQELEREIERRGIAEDALDKIRRVPVVGGGLALQAQQQIQRIARDAACGDER